MRNVVKLDQLSPTQAAHQLIHDELLLDGSARLNLATFVTTWMEPQAEKLMAESFAHLGGDMPTFTLNFSRAGNQVIGQYYDFLRLGRVGYTRIMEALRDTATWLSGQIARMGYFQAAAEHLEKNPPAGAKAPAPGFAH